MSKASHLSLVALALVAAGCNDRQDPLAPADGASLVLASKSAPVADISGTWLWSEDLIFSVAAPLTGVFFGIQPEGPITHFRCHESGTMTLIQSGSSFGGTATQASECRTRGGQVFSPPVFPPILDVAEGTIKAGACTCCSVRATSTAPTTPRSRWKVVRPSAWMALAGASSRGIRFRAFPLDPPDQAGASPTFNWEAVRP